MSDLDERFGVAVTPRRLGALEQEVSPTSLQKLDEQTGLMLAEIMTLAAKDLGIASAFYSEAPILWVIDEIGEIWFSLEEVFSISERDYLFPRTRNLPSDLWRNESGRERLGHPSLLRGRSKKGRIGGEIVFDRNDDRTNWVITNLSGRYGRSRSETHLIAAAQEFSAYGVSLVHKFYD